MKVVTCIAVYEHSAVVSKRVQNELVGKLEERYDALAERVVDRQRQIAELLGVLRLDPGRFGFVANADDRGDAVLEQVALLDERKWDANLLCL